MERGVDQIRMGRQGEKRMKLIIKERKKRSILLVCVTNLPVRMQGFRIPVIAKCGWPYVDHRAMNVGVERVGATVTGVTKCNCFVTIQWVITSKFPYLYGYCVLLHDFVIGM